MVNYSLFECVLVLNRRHSTSMATEDNPAWYSWLILIPDDDYGIGGF